MRWLAKMAWMSIGAGCIATDRSIDTDSGVPREACAWEEAPELEAVPYVLPDGCAEGALPVGTPPQGGAPFLPLRMRLHANLGEDVLRVDAEGQARSGGSVIGEEALSVSALCANAGTDVGWYLLGELHLRFPGAEQPTLDGVDLDVQVTVSWDGGEETNTMAGPACWSL